MPQSYTLILAGLLFASNASAIVLSLAGNGQGTLAEISLVDGSTQVLNSGNPLPNGIAALGYDASGTLWGGDSIGNIFTFDSSGSTFTVQSPSAVTGGATALAFDSLGTLWIGNSTGQLAGYDTDTWTVLSTVAVPTPITALDFDASGTLWAGNSNGDLMTIDLGSEIVSLENTLMTPLQALAFDSDGTLWAGDGASGNLFSIEPVSGATNVINTLNPFPGGLDSLAIPEPANLSLISGICALLYLNRRRLKLPE